VSSITRSIAIGVTAGLCTVLLVAGIVTITSNRRINRQYRLEASPIVVARDSASVARGEHLVRAVLKCVECHGEDLGGTALTNAAAFGQIAAPNITGGRGGKGGSYSDAELGRLIRHGVKRDGRAAVIMPVEAYRFLADEDLGAVVAYLRSAPAVDKDWPPIRYGPLARALIAAGALPVFGAATIDQSRREAMPRPAGDTTAEYGHYLTRIAGCQGCHNPALSGGPIAGGDPGSPPAPNLTPTGIDHYTEEDFVRVLRSGTGIGGRVISDYMPWKSIRRMSDSEIHAIWLYLLTLPRKDMGQR